jgi:hypothetical protein
MNCSTAISLLCSHMLRQFRHDQAIGSDLMVPVVRSVKLSDFFPPELFFIKKCLHGGLP